MTNPNKNPAHPPGCIYQAAAYVVSALRGTILIFPCILHLFDPCVLSDIQATASLPHY